VSRQKIVPATSRIHASKWAISRHIGQMDYALNWRQQANALIELPCAIRKTITSAGRGLSGCKVTDSDYDVSHAQLLSCPREHF